MALNLLVHVVNTAACWTTAFVALSYFLMMYRPHNAWTWVLQCGLILVVACTATTPVALFQSGEAPTWWAIGQRVGTALLAVYFYNYRFGWTREAKLVRAVIEDWAWNIKHYVKSIHTRRCKTNKEKANR